MCFNNPNSHLTLRWAATDSIQQEFLALTAHSFHWLLFSCQTHSLKFSLLSRRAEMKVPVQAVAIPRNMFICRQVHVRGQRQTVIIKKRKEEAVWWIQQRRHIRYKEEHAKFLLHHMRRRFPKSGLGACRGHQWSSEKWEWSSCFIRLYFLWTNQLLSHIQCKSYHTQYDLSQLKCWSIECRHASAFFYKL